jgi:hypothetical protein
LKTNRLLAGTLAIVLLTGLASPVFASEPHYTTIEGEDDSISMPDFIPSIEFDDIIFDNGGDPILGGGLTIGDVLDQQITTAEDFVLLEDTVVTDFHFVVISLPGIDDSYDFFIMNDDSGAPGDIIASGVSTDVEVEPIPGSAHSEVWFFLDEPFSAEAGVTYWIGIHQISGHTGWMATTGGLGAGACQSNEDVIPPIDWVCTGTHNWFLLSGHSPIVGGELIPIESTSLILAGAQSFSWMIPLVLSGIGIGMFIVSRKSE